MLESGSGPAPSRRAVSLCGHADGSEPQLNPTPTSWSGIGRSEHTWKSKEKRGYEDALPHATGPAGPGPVTDPTAVTVTAGHGGSGRPRCRGRPHDGPGQLPVRPAPRGC